MVAKMKEIAIVTEIPKKMGLDFREDNLGLLIELHPDFEFANQAKVAFTDINLKLTAREERYMSSWAEKIPIIKIPIQPPRQRSTRFLWIRVSPHRPVSEK